MIDRDGGYLMPEVHPEPIWAERHDPVTGEPAQFRRPLVIHGTPIGPVLPKPMMRDGTGAAAGGVAMADVELGITRLAAAMGGCRHEHAEPVDLLLTGERVAWLCPDCDVALPKEWA